MKTCSRLVRLALVALSALTASACGDGDGGGPMMMVGAPCHSDLDCGGLYCVKDSGGTCLPLCVSDLDCGPGFTCAKKDRQGAPGQVKVCKAK